MRAARRSQVRALGKPPRWPDRGLERELHARRTQFPSCTWDAATLAGPSEAWARHSARAPVLFRRHHAVAHSARRAAGARSALRFPGGCVRARHHEHRAVGHRQPGLRRAPRARRVRAPGRRQARHAGGRPLLEQVAAVFVPCRVVYARGTHNQSVDFVHAWLLEWHISKRSRNTDRALHASAKLYHRAIHIHERRNSFI